VLRVVNSDKLVPQKGSCLSTVNHTGGRVCLDSSTRRPHTRPAGDESLQLLLLVGQLLPFGVFRTAVLNSLCVVCPSGVIIMDLFDFAPKPLDAGKFELRVSPSGVPVIARKGEVSTGACSSRAAAPIASSAPALAGAGGPGPAVPAASAPEIGGGAAKVYKVSELPLEERFRLARSVAEECIQDEELRALLSKKAHPVCYDGFEPSGRMHLAQGIYKAILVNKLTKAGAVFRFWVADWFALLNNKMGGDLKKIRTVGKYMIEVSYKSAVRPAAGCASLLSPNKVSTRGRGDEDMLRLAWKLHCSRAFNRGTCCHAHFRCRCGVLPAWTCRMWSSCGPATRSTRAPTSTGCA